MYLKKFKNIVFKKQILHNNHENKKIALFISIPKNASKTTLNSLSLGENRNIENTTSLVIYENHALGKILKDKFDFNKLFVFCFSRNPYQRTISWYEYHRKIKPYCDFDFKDWVESGLPHHFTKLNGTNYIKETISPLLQYNYIDKCKIDFVGKIENFKSDLKLVSEKLNLLCMSESINYKFIPRDLKLNTSKRKQEKNYFDDNTKKIVSEILSKDFEFFNYPK